MEPPVVVMLIVHRLTQPHQLTRVGTRRAIQAIQTVLAMIATLAAPMKTLKKPNQQNQLVKQRFQKTREILDKQVVSHLKKMTVNLKISPQIHRKMKLKMMSKKKGKTS